LPHWRGEMKKRRTQSYRYVKNLVDKRILAKFLIIYHCGYFCMQTYEISLGILVKGVLWVEPKFKPHHNFWPCPSNLTSKKNYS
jgi:hypothetical protein